MKVKIGNKVYDSEKEPIMIVLSGDDKDNISRMGDQRKYCSYPDGMNVNEVSKFMSLEVEEIRENCPHCGHHCEDEYIGVKARLINEKYYDTVQCTSCNRTFDRVYAMVPLGSKPTKTTQEILKGDK